MIVACFAMPGHRRHASFAIGPLSMVPFGLPWSSLRMTTALSSNLTRVPSGLRNSFFWRTMTAGITCFLTPGFPFLTAI